MNTNKRRRYWGNIPKFKQVKYSETTSVGNKYQALSADDDMDSTSEEGEIVSKI